MSIFTVLDVSPEVRRFPSQYGEMVSYRLNLRNGDGTEHLNIELVRKATSTAPKAGVEYEGYLEDRGAHGWKLNLTPAVGGSSPGSRPEDPLRQKRIVRQHSQNMALQAVRLAVDLGLLMPNEGEGHPQNTADLFSLIAKTADWFDKDVESAAS